MQANVYKDVSDDTRQSRSLFRTLAFRIGLGLSLFVLVIFLSTLYVTQTKSREVLLEQAEKINQGVARAITLKLQERLAKTEALTRSLANLGANLEKRPETFKQVIPKMLAHTGMDDLIAGGGIWPEPKAFDGVSERRSFFWGKNSVGELEYYNDYNDPDGLGYHREEWYVPAKYLPQGGVYWSKSYIDPYSLEPMVTCSVPIVIEGTFAGVATVDLRLSGLSQFMSEQVKVTGGYAFAIDRNGRLLSKPLAPGWAAISQQLAAEGEFPTMEDLRLIEPMLTPFNDYLNRVDQIYWEQSQRVDEQRHVDMAEAIAQGSYQVDAAEASVIAKLLLTQTGPLFSESFDLERDIFAAESTSMTVLGLPYTGWKVLVAMPSRYSLEAVNAISQNILGLLFLMLFLSAVFFVLFFHRTFVQPINALSIQIRSLVKRKDYETRLAFDRGDELGELAYWFNVRTEQLRVALQKLTRQNKTLEETRAFAESANRSKSIFLASMSHEIRTPMNAIIGMSEVLSRANLDRESAEYLGVIKNASQGLLSLVNDIMDFSKVEAGKLDLESLVFDLRDMLDDCADLLAFQASAKNIEFVYYVSPSVPARLRGDPTRLRQVILNLGGNAVKFTNEGFVELWVDGVLEESADRGSEQFILQVRIEDSGIGIPEEKRAQLFQPFKQADSSTTREYGGTGLGLAISMRLAELMSGSIELDSDVSKGTEFRFSVPLDLPQTGQTTLLDEYSRPIARPNYGCLEHERILLALVNEPHQVEVLRSYAEATGYQFVALNSVEKWLNKLKQYEACQTMSLVWEASSLGDLTMLKRSLPLRDKPFPMLLVSSLRSDLVQDLSVLKPQIDIEFLATPIKYPALLKALIQLEQRVGRGEYRHDDRSETTRGLDPNAPRPWENIELATGSAASISAASDKAERLSAYRHKKILVAEDNRINQQVMTLLLQGLGLTADVVKDGESALYAVRDGQYDLVLMDWQMPKMDGLSASRAIRDQLGSTVPILAVTANAMSGDLERCLEAGMNDYLSKPVKIESLAAKLERWLILD